MDNNTKWTLTEEEKEKYISSLTNELAVLRSKAEVSQEELAGLIGVSRQTYGSIERQTRRMTWNTYLSLIMFFDYNKKTHKMLRMSSAFPTEVLRRFNDGDEPGPIDIGTMFSDGMKDITQCLDEQALRSIRTMIMVEYARCTDTPGDIVIKSFEGIEFTNNPTPERKKATRALKAIKEGRNRADVER